MDWVENWTCCINEGDGDLFQAPLNLTMEDSTIREIIDNMIMENQQDLYHL
jgi:hypothetical protein